MMRNVQLGGPFGLAQRREKDGKRPRLGERGVVAEEREVSTYEVGLADVLGKDVVLLSQTPNDVPFDFLGLRLVTYENSIGGVRRLSDELRKRLERFRPPAV
jgi:hypothetical protein